MDIVGPLPETLKGNKYIVTLTDYFSKWAEAAALLNKSAEGVAIFMHSVSMFTEILDIVVAIVPLQKIMIRYIATCDCNKQANKKHHSYYILAGNV